MSFSHLYYTSARTGVYSGLGFQVYTMTKDITEDEKADIIRYGSYKAPEQLSAQIDEHSIATLYPKSFSFYSLSSGRMALTAARYIGKDYSNRNGNYFSDTAVFELSSLEGRAIEYFESADFKERLTAQEEESTQPPDFLQPAANLQRGTIITRARVVQFIQQPGHAEILQNMLEAVIQHSHTNKKLVILDEPLHIAYWIAAIQYCFPQRLASTLSFTTYTEEPLYCPATLCGVYAGAMPPSSWAYDFNLFNVKYQSYPQFEISPYTEKIVRLFIENTSAVDQFLAFVDLVAESSITSALNNLLSLYQILHQPVDTLQLAELNEAVSVYLANNDSQILHAITNSIARNWLSSDFQFVAGLSNKVISSLAYKLITLCETTVNEDVKKLATRFFLESWLRLLASAKEEHDFAARRMYLTTAIEMTASNKPFHLAALDEQHLSRVYDFFVAQPSEGLWKELVLATFAHIKAAGVPIEDGSLKTHLLLMVDLAVKMQFKLDDVYDIVLRDEQYFVQTIRLSLEAYASNEGKRNYLLQTMLAFVELRPELHEFMTHLMQSNPIVGAHIFTQYEQQIATASKPISMLVGPTAEPTYLKITPEQNDLLFAVAAENLLAKPELDLAELQLLWDSETWRILPPNTHLDLIDRAQDSLLGTTAKNYEQLLNKWLDFGEELQNSKKLKEKMLIVKLLLVLVKVEKKIALKEADLLFIQQVMELLTEPQKQQLLIARLDTFLAATEKDSKARAIFLELAIKHCRSVILKSLQRRALSEKMVQLVADYYEYLIAHQVALDEQDQAFFNDVKGLRKSLKEVYKQNQKLPIYETLEQQVKGKQTSIFNKILPKNLFKKGDK